MNGQPRSAAAEVSLFLCGDVMTGRGIDQVLPYPSDPALYESFVHSAADYVRLAEGVNGPIPQPVDFGYIWGDALGELAARSPDRRIINLETAVTTSSEPEPKGINYRMHPRNTPCIEAAGIDCCVLANNHVLDWGTGGLNETLETLESTGISLAGAGRTAKDAAKPAVLSVNGESRVLVFGFGTPSSGVPLSWQAGENRPGVNVLPDLTGRTASRVAEHVVAERRPGDLVVLSIHWGDNWGYEVPPEQRAFAHALIDAGAADVVHGHSSHHPKGVEVYRGRLVLYGCGDFINDYEGISGYEEYRSDLVLAYFVTLDAAHGQLIRLDMAPFRTERFRLSRPSKPEAEWLGRTLNREGRVFGTGVERAEDGALRLQW